MISYFQLIFYTSITGIFIAVSLIVFHFEHLQQSASEFFLLSHNLTINCKLIAKSLFVLQFFHTFLSVLVYFETYRTMRSISAKKNCNKQYLLGVAPVISGFIGIMQSTGIGDVPSPLCLAKLNTIELSVALVIQGVMCCVMTAFNIALYKLMEKTRKATGRKQSKNDKLVVIRFSLYNSVVVITFLLNVLHHLFAIDHEAILLMITIFQYTLAPFIFPITFVLSTQKYRNKMKGIVKGCYCVKCQRGK